MISFVILFLTRIVSTAADLRSAKKTMAVETTITGKVRLLFPLRPAGGGAQESVKDQELL